MNALCKPRRFAQFALLSRAFRAPAQRAGNNAILTTQVHESAVGAEEPRRGSTDNRIILSKCRNVQTDLKQIMSPHSVQQSRHRSHAPPRFTAGVVGPREGRRARGRGRRGSSGAGDNAQVNEIIRHGKIEVAKTEKEAIVSGWSSRDCTDLKSASG